MKNSTVVLICIMVISFVFSISFFFISAGLFIVDGTSKLTKHIASGDVGEIFENNDGVKVSKEDGVKVDIPGVHVIVDDKGVDVNVLGIHVDYRDDDDEKDKEKKDSGEKEEKNDKKEKDEN